MDDIFNDFSMCIQILDFQTYTFASACTSIHVITTLYHYIEKPHMHA